MTIREFVEICHALRNASPNAFYAHVDLFCKQFDGSMIYDCTFIDSHGKQITGEQAKAMHDQMFPQSPVGKNSTVDQHLISEMLDALRLVQHWFEAGHVIVKSEQQKINDVVARVEGRQPVLFDVQSAFGIVNELGGLKGEEWEKAARRVWTSVQE